MAATFVDASVLYSPALRDVLLELGAAGVLRLRWSARVQEEWLRAVLRHRPDLPRDKLLRAQHLMELHLPEARVDDYAQEEAQLVLPDPDDRHVLAAAIVGGADTILTFNLRDFPLAICQQYGVRAAHPDGFLTALLAAEEEAVAAAIRQVRLRLRNPPKTAAEFVSRLAKHNVPGFAAALQHRLPQL